MTIKAVVFKEIIGKTRDVKMNQLLLAASVESCNREKQGLKMAHLIAKKEENKRGLFCLWHII